MKNMNQPVTVQPSAKHSQGQIIHGFGLAFLNEAIVRAKVFFLVIMFQKCFLFSLFFLLRRSSRLQKSLVHVQEFYFLQMSSQILYLCPQHLAVVALFILNVI